MTNLKKKYASHTPLGAIVQLTATKQRCVRKNFPLISFLSQWKIQLNLFSRCTSMQLLWRKMWNLLLGNKVFHNGRGKKMVILVTHKRFFWVLTYGCSTSSSFSSGMLQDLILGFGFSLQYHLSGSFCGSVPSGNLRHFRHSGLSHCTQIWSGRCLQ